MNVVDKPFGVVLLIGGCGFIGHHIIEDLVSRCGVAVPAEVHVYDRSIDSTRSFYSSIIPRENYHEGDMCDAPALKKALQTVKPDVVFDLVSPPMFIHTLDFYMRVNVDARRRLLELARDVGSVKAFVYNSSAGVVHDSYSDLVNADESYPVLYAPQQPEPYSHSKAVAETIVLEANGMRSGSGEADDAARRGVMLTAAVRLCSPFGDNHGETTNVILQNARAGSNRFQVGDGKNLSDWTYIENGARGHLLVAQALLKASEASTMARDEDRVDGEAFFITNGEPVPFWDFTRALGAAAGYTVEASQVRVLPRWLMMTVAFVAEWSTWILSLGQRRSAMTRQGIRYSTITRYHSIDKARRRLKYHPSISLDEGIKRSVVSWIADQKTQ